MHPSGSLKDILHAFVELDVIVQRLTGAVFVQALMDPVCMLTCYPQLLRNFVYKLPTLRESVGSILGFANAIRWVLARDLVIAEVGHQLSHLQKVSIPPSEPPPHALYLSPSSCLKSPPHQALLRLFFKRVMHTSCIGFWWCTCADNAPCGGMSRHKQQCSIFLRL